MRWFWLILIVLALILVPFFLYEDYFNALASRLAAGDVSPAWTSLVIVGLLGSDVVLPIPSSLISAAAGLLLGFWRGAATIWVGMTVSCVIGYFIGAWSAGGARRLLGESGVRRAAELAASYGQLAIVLCRPVPVLAEATVIFAGLIRSPFARFLATCVWSNLGVALGYAAIGAFAMRVDSFIPAFLGAIVLPGLAAVGARLWLGHWPAGSQKPEARSQK